MKNASQDSWSLTLLRAVNAWRKRDGLSREAAAVAIVDAYRALGEPPVGSEFRATRDAFEDARINAQRIFRWLDDQTKDCTLLPANFVPSVLRALPPDLRLACVEHMLLPLGFSAQPIGGEDGQPNVAAVLACVAKEGGEATASIAALVDGASTAELQQAQQEITESIAAQTDALHMVEGLLQRARGAA